MYGVGSSRLVCCATYVNVKSLRASATSSTAEATSVQAKAATSAFWAERDSRRRRVCAPQKPATTA